MKYKAIFPFIHDMGTVPSVTVSDKPMETKEEEALWYFNSYRDHDCLKRREKLPKGMRFELIAE